MFFLPKADGNDRVITLAFTWGEEAKDVSSTIIGVSPEFEIALYTLCFLCGGENNAVQLANYHLNIKCYKIRSHLATSYPELLARD